MAGRRQKSGELPMKTIRNLALVLTLTMLVLVMFGHQLAAQSPASDEGFIEPFKTVHVASPESGVIKSIEVGEGSTVKAGDVICRLDTEVLQVALLAAKLKLESRGKLEAAQAKLKNAEHHLSQMNALLEKNHASGKEVRQAQLEYDLANADVNTATDELLGYEIEMRKIQTQIERRIILAPNDGVVLTLPHHEGEAVTTVESHVATIAQLDQLKVRYFLTTQQAAKMKQGGRARVSIPATNQNTTATIDFIAPVTDSNSGTVRVELRLDNRHGNFRSGLRCILNEAEASTANGEANRFIQFK